MGHTCNMQQGNRNAHKILITEPKERPPGRRRCRWEDNMKVDFKKIVCEGMNWIHLAQERVQWRGPVNSAINIWVP